MKQRHQSQAPISVICCYRDSTSWKSLMSSAKRFATLNVEYIGIDNSTNQRTLPEAYNRGKDLATGELLLFVHDDVQFKTTGWDSILSEFYETLPNCGVVGFAGGTDAYNGPMTWWTNVGENHIIRNMVQRLTDRTDVRFEDSAEPVEVIGLDGFAFAVKRELLRDFLWSNEIGFWHGYDLDLCYHVRFVQGRTNYVLPMPLIHHLSLGTLNVEWGKSMIKIWMKYRKWLCRRGTEGWGRDALVVFVNWTHELAIQCELIEAMKKNDHSFLTRMVVTLCFSQSKWVKRFGFKLLSRTIT